MPLGPPPIVLQGSNPFLDMLSKAAIMAIQQGFREKELEIQGKQAEKLAKMQLEAQLATKGWTKTPPPEPTTSEGMTPEQIDQVFKSGGAPVAAETPKTEILGETYYKRPSPVTVQPISQIPGAAVVQVGEHIQVVKPEKQNIEDLVKTMMLSGGLIPLGSSLYKPQVSPEGNVTLVDVTKMEPWAPMDAEGNLRGPVQWISPGQPVPPGYRPVSKGSAPVTKVQVENIWEPGTKGKVEQSVLGASETVGNLVRTLKLYHPDFLTAAGQLKAKGTELLERSDTLKTVSDLFGLNPTEAQDFLRQYSAFRTSAISDFNAFRKETTGVAFGPQELELFIKPSWPNPSQSQSAFEGSMATVLYKNLFAVKREQELLKQGIILKNMPPEERIKIFDRMPIEKFKPSEEDVKSLIEPEVMALRGRTDPQAQSLRRIYRQIINMVVD